MVLCSCCTLQKYHLLYQTLRIKLGTYIFYSVALKLSEIRFSKCFRRELDRPLYQVPDGTCPTKGFFGDTKVLGDAVQDAKRKRATRKAAAIGVAEFCGPADDP